MIIVRLISGLGNQLFQYAVGRRLALMTGQPLKLDLRFFEGQSLRKYQLDRFEIAADIATASEADRLKGFYQSDGLTGKILRKAASYFPKQTRSYYKEGEWWVHEPEIYKIRRSVYLDGYWQSYKYFLDFPGELLPEFRVKEHLYSGGEQALLAEISGNNAAVSMHIRRGDYVTDTATNNMMGVLPLTYYERAIELVKKKVSNPFFYVFSDDTAWAKQNINGLENVRFVELSSADKDCIELELMSKCRHNVIANSSFSWWGAFLNSNPEKVVIAPSRWVVSPEQNARIELQFPTWVKL